MKSRLIAIFFIFAFMVLSCHPAYAIIIINEVLADPAGDLTGDANQDGTASTSQDEFIEILNMSDSEIDISNWSLNDAIKTRHVFNEGTVLSPYEFFVVFGGGNPVFPGAHRWQVASSGGLGLNNSGDKIEILDLSDIAVSKANYGNDGGKNQSLVRFPEGTDSEFVLHFSLPQAQGRLFSPGTMVNGEGMQNPAVSTIPEAATLLSFTFGYAAIVLRRKKKLTI